MQHALPSHAHPNRTVTRRLAWLAVGLALLAAGAIWPGSAALLAGGLAWLTHVGLDRGLGFGLRTPEGFQRG
jgi:hypothetical protein